MESYLYFDSHIRKLPKRSDGSIDTMQPGFSDNDVDAFRHTYVSGVFTHEYGERMAMLLGWFNEVGFPSSVNDRNMDLWNNAIGRDLAKKYSSKDRLAESIREALQSGKLITHPDDDRIYQGAILIKPSGITSVVVIAKDESGANNVFFDFTSNKMMSKDEFVEAIQLGQYPGYSIRSEKGKIFPFAKPNKTTTDNLG